MYITFVFVINCENIFHVAILTQICKYLPELKEVKDLFMKIRPREK